MKMKKLKRNKEQEEETRDKEEHLNMENFCFKKNLVCLPTKNSV